MTALEPQAPAVGAYEPSAYEPSAPTTLRPHSVAELQAILEQGAASGQRIAARGGGTALGLGNPSTGLDAWIDMRSLNRIVEYFPEDQVLVAQAGITLAELTRVVTEQRQVFGVDAPAAERATLGGLVAVAGFGPRRPRYGAPRDLVLGATVVRADGALARSGSRVVKNVAGFDLHKLYCGSLGNLALLTEVILRLHPKPEATRTLLTAPISAEQVVDLVRRVRDAQLEPSSFLANQDTDAALSPGASAIRYRLSLRFEGFEPGVVRDVQRLADTVLAPSGVVGECLPESDAIAYWQRHDRERQAGPLRVRATHLPTHFQRLDLWLEPLSRTLGELSVCAYPSLGISFVSGVPALPAGLADLLGALDSLRAQLREAGGHLIVEQAPLAVLERFDAWGPAPSGITVMAGLRQRFDPQGRLNPGRFVGGL
jgi:glycolate oxidase FAD binding subunit